MTDKLSTPGSGFGSNPLADLGLSTAEYQALTEQGFVAAERRQHNGRVCGPYYKLRWRLNGRQKVRYLGRDHGHAERVRAALADLQRPAHLLRQVVRWLHQAREQLREIKAILQP